MKKLLIIGLSLVSLISMVGCTKQDTEKAEQIIADKIAEEVSENLYKWEEKLTNIEDHMEDYPKKMKLTEIEDFEGVNVKISEYEEDSSKYELLVLFNYDTDYFEDTVMFEIIVNKNVKLADIDLSDISNARGVEIIKMSFYEDDEITKLFIKEGWHDYKVDGDYDSRIEVLALEEDEYGYPSADEIFNDELNARLGNLEVVEY